MKAVILAAGEGRRMHPLTYTRPKVMLPIANKPILEHLLIQAKKAGIEDFIFVIGYHGETVRRYFGDGNRWRVNIDYVTQRRQLGTAHALRMAQGFVDSKFLLLNGDILVKESDIARIMARDGIILGVIEAENTEDLGVVEVARNRVIRIYEKVAIPPSNLVNAGIYLLTPGIFDALARTRRSPRGEYEITDSLQLLIDEGGPVSYEKLDYWLDLGCPWDLLKANESTVWEIEPGNLGEIEENVTIKGRASIGKGTVIRANSYISGPVVIGENCEIGPNCYIRPVTSIGNNCHIGNGVEIKNSIIMNGTKLPHQNYVGDSVIGERCNFGAGTKIANLRLNEKEIRVGKIETRRRKLGAIVGDEVKTGINASINVGSLIGNATWIGPGAVASGVIMPDSRIF